MGSVLPEVDAGGLVMEHAGLRLHRALQLEEERLAAPDRLLEADLRRFQRRRRDLHAAAAAAEAKWSSRNTEGVLTFGVS